MKQITEDYVSYETAQLLKEKGFDGICRAAYSHYGSLSDIEIKEFLTNKTCPDTHWECTAPTHQMALKWLREVHNIFIEINVSIDLNGDYHYAYSILDKECKYIKRFIGYYSNHESCVEAALLYVLKNLI